MVLLYGVPSLDLHLILDVLPSSKLSVGPRTLQLKTEPLSKMSGAFIFFSLFASF
jgi:hypothetical protein